MISTRGLRVCGTPGDQNVISLCGFISFSTLVLCWALPQLCLVPTDAPLWWVLKWPRMLSRSSLLEILSNSVSTIIWENCFYFLLIISFKNHLVLPQATISGAIWCGVGKVRVTAGGTVFRKAVTSSSVFDSLRVPVSAPQSSKASSDERDWETGADNEHYIIQKSKWSPKHSLYFYTFRKLSEGARCFCVVHRLMLCRPATKQFKLKLWVI